MQTAHLGHPGNLKMCVCECEPVRVPVSVPQNRSSDSFGLEWILRICLLKKLQARLMQSATPKAVFKSVSEEIRDHSIALLASGPGQAAQFVAGHCDTHREPTPTQNSPSTCHAVLFIAFK